MSKLSPKGMGWCPDLPDARDFSVENTEVRALLEALPERCSPDSPQEFDLSADGDGQYLMSPANQKDANSSPVFAVLDLVEYFQRRIHGHTFDGSHLFLYQVVRNYRRGTGDCGADLRTTLKAFRRFGTPSSKFYPYDPHQVDGEPQAFLYGVSQQIVPFYYVRLDPPNQCGKKTWNIVTAFLAAGFPMAFGFAVPSSTTNDATIMWRPDLDAPLGGQAAVATGYRLNHFGAGQHALRFRTYWGSQWGDNGSGWLPKYFVERQLARDFWTMIAEPWSGESELFRPNL